MGLGVRARISNQQGCIMKSRIVLIAILAIFSSAQAFRQIDPVELGKSHAGQAENLENPIGLLQEGISMKHISGKAIWKNSVFRKGAKFLKLHFVNFHLAQGEELKIYDAFHNLRQNIKASGPHNDGSFWSITIPGSTAYLEWQGTDSGNSHFQINKVFVGEYLPGNAMREPGAKSVCNMPVAGPFRSVSCYLPGQEFENEQIANNAESTVAVLTIDQYGSGSWCSGSLVSSQGFVLTNQHCIKTKSSCRNVEFVFNYQHNSCQEGLTGELPIQSEGFYCDGSDAATYVSSPYKNCTSRDMEDLDFTFAKVKTENVDELSSKPILEMELNHEVIQNTKDIYIIGHPQGEPKFVSEGVLDFTGEYSLHYIVETLGGNSGSPVFSKYTHRLIGLHHCGGCTSASSRNRGMFITHIREYIDRYGNFFEASSRLELLDFIHSEVQGDGDPYAEPGETYSLSLQVKNSGNQASEATQLSVSASHANLNVQSISIPRLNQGESIAISINYEIHTDAACGSQLEISLLINEKLHKQVLALGRANFYEAKVTPFLNIPDNDLDGVKSSIDVDLPEGDEVLEILGVGVEIEHTYIGDLQLSLIAPDGTSLLLHNESGGSTNDIRTVYGNQASQTKPEGDLSTFVGKGAKGKWSLKVADVLNAYDGELESWSLKLRTKQRNFICD